MLTNTLKGYQRQWLVPDFMAGLIVAILITPQAIAYALLAGLPPEAGLYSALLPVLVYALLGSSPLLAVGPAAVISLMTLETLHKLAPVASAQYVSLAAALAFLVGVWLILFWLIDLGRWTTFISATVISAFTSATAILIVASQLPAILGIHSTTSADLWHSLSALWQHRSDIHLEATLFALTVLLFLLAWQQYLPKLSQHLPSPLASLFNKAGPLLAVVLGIAYMSWQQPSLSVVGELPQGLPHLGFPNISLSEWKTLLPSSAVLALIAYLSSLSASEAIKESGQSSAKQNQELMALGAANIASALSQAFPTGGSFSRTLVNKAAGAKTQMAGIFTVLLVGLFCVFANQAFKLLPQAVLGVIIVLAAWPLIRFQNGMAAWRFQKSEGLVWLLSFVMVLISGAEKGILLGMLLSLVLYLKRTSMPHIAEVGRVGNSDHFRNVLHYKTNTHPEILLIRIDENLYFANCQYLQDIIMQRLNARQGIKQVVLVGSAINYIDYNAFQTLSALLEALRTQDIQLHLAEFKNPVLQQLKSTPLLAQLPPGRVFFTASEALRELGQI